jgi:hypothetical protein
MRKRHTAPRRSISSRQNTKGFAKQALRPARSEREPLKPARPLAVQTFDPDPAAVYSIETAAQLANVPRRMILVYCKHGLMAPIADPLIWGYWFTADAIRTLRRIQALRTTCGDDLPGIAMILDLLNEVQTLRAQIRAVAG